jgi:ATP-dependent RNA helicase DeaD
MAPQHASAFVGGAAAVRSRTSPAWRCARVVVAHQTQSKPGRRATVVVCAAVPASAPVLESGDRGSSSEGEDEDEDEDHTWYGVEPSELDAAAAERGNVVASGGAVDLGELDTAGRNELAVDGYARVMNVDVADGGALDADEDNSDLLSGIGFDAMIDRPQFLDAIVNDFGYETTTHVQLAAMPRITERDDVVIQSYTGTGKTLAFLLPLLEMVDEEADYIQAIVVAPTRELAMQIHRECERVAAKTSIRCMPLIGGANPARQVDKIRLRVPHVIIGTPGRLAELEDNRVLRLRKVEIVVVDEVDQCMQDGFREHLEFVINACKRDRQLVFASATGDNEAVRSYAQTWMTDPVLLRITGKRKVPSNITHWCTIVPARLRIDILRKLMTVKDAPKAAICFVDDPRRVDIVCERLFQMKLSAGALRGNAHKLERAEVLRLFRKGAVPLLVTTEVAARGLDVPEVSHVFNLDLPTDADHYIHRAGRCGRAGKPGTVVSIATAETAFVIGKLEKEIEVPITRMEPRHGVYAVPLKRETDSCGPRRTVDGKVTSQTAFADNNGTNKAAKPVREKKYGQDPRRNVSPRGQAAHLTRSAFDVGSDTYSSPRLSARSYAGGDRGRSGNSGSRDRRAFLSLKHSERAGADDERRQSGYVGARNDVASTKPHISKPVGPGNDRQGAGYADSCDLDASSRLNYVDPNADRRFIGRETARREGGFARSRERELYPNPRYGEQTGATGNRREGGYAGSRGRDDSPSSRSRDRAARDRSAVPERDGSENRGSYSQSRNGDRTRPREARPRDSRDRRDYKPEPSRSVDKSGSKHVFAGGEGASGVEDSENMRGNERLPYSRPEHRSRGPSGERSPRQDGSQRSGTDGVQYRANDIRTNRRIDRTSLLDDESNAMHGDGGGTRGVARFGGEQDKQRHGGQRTRLDFTGTSRSTNGNDTPSGALRRLAGKKSSDNPRGRVSKSSFLTDSRPQNPRVLAPRGAYTPEAKSGLPVGRGDNTIDLNSQAGFANGDLSPRRKKHAKRRPIDMKTRATQGGWVGSRSGSPKPNQDSAQ